MNKKSLNYSNTAKEERGAPLSLRGAQQAVQSLAEDEGAEMSGLGSGLSSAHGEVGGQGGPWGGGEGGEGGAGPAGLLGSMGAVRRGGECADPTHCGHPEPLPTFLPARIDCGLRSCAREERQKKTAVK